MDAKPVWEVAEVPPASQGACAPIPWAELLRGATDEVVAGPMWRWPPEAAKPLIHERRRRGMWALIDDEGADAPGEGA